MKIKIFFKIIFLFPFFLNAQNLVINEFSSSNYLNIKHVDDKNYDWIELYNGTDNPINIKAYGLSDDSLHPFKWVFPDTTILPHNYFIVWASDKNISKVGEEMHTNWKIKSEGEVLLLTSADQQYVSSISGVNLHTGLSYGRFPDGSNQFYFFDKSTPSKANINNGFTLNTNSLTFSKQGGSNTAPFYLELNCNIPNAEIYYSLDGSEPSPFNINGKVYNYKLEYAYKIDDKPGAILSDTLFSFIYDKSKPIYIDYDKLITNGLFNKTPLTVVEAYYGYNLKEQQPKEIKKATVVRAAAYIGNTKVSDVLTNTYILRDEGSIDTSLPLIALTTNPNYLISYENGIYTPGKTFDEWRTNNPNENANAFSDANYHNRGEKYEILANIEFFEKQQREVSFNRIIGVRINGESGRSFPLKSFRVYVNDYNEKQNLDYDLFNNGNGDIKSFLLRSSGDDQFETYIRDPLVSELSESLNFETQDHKACNLFINGEYWGIYYIRQRQDKNYIKQFYNIPKDSIYLINEPIKGDYINNDKAAIEFTELYNFILDNSMNDSSNFHYVTSKIDINNFIDYNIANIYFGNIDWGDRNIRAWKSNTTNKEYEIKECDGKWRWMMNDVDESFGVSQPIGKEIEISVFKYPQFWYSILIFDFKENKEFVKLFNNRFLDVLNTTFNKNQTVPILELMKTNIETSILNHSERWGYPIMSKDINEWHLKLERIEFFLKNRNKVQRKQLSKYFKLGKEYQLNIDVSDEMAGYVTVNSIDILSKTNGVSENPYPWNGYYFKNAPIILVAHPYKGWNFSHWEGINETNNTISLTTKKKTINIKAVFVKEVE